MFEFKDVVVEKNEDLIKLLSEISKRYSDVFVCNSELETYCEYSHQINGQSNRMYYLATNETKSFAREKVISSYEHEQIIKEIIDEIKSHIDFDTDSYSERVWYSKVYCPYTNKLLTTNYFTLHEYNMRNSTKSKKVKLTYKREGSRNIIEREVSVTRVGSFKMPNNKGTYLESYYAPEVIELFKREWKHYGNNVIQKEGFLHTDTIDNVMVYYKSTSGLVSQRPRFNMKHKRHYIVPPRSIYTIDSPDIEDFDAKLYAIFNNLEYEVVKTEDQLNNEKVFDIQEILNKDLTDIEKLNQIKEMFERED